MPSILTLHLLLCGDADLAYRNAPAQGWFLTLIEQLDPDWAQQLHPQNPTRDQLPLAYTLSPLWSESQNAPGRKIAAGTRLRLRLALLDDTRAAWLCGALSSATLPLLSHVPVQLLSIPEFSLDHPDIVHLTWEQLADAPAASRLRLDFVTPTAFKSQDNLILYPEPERLLGSSKRLGSWSEAWKRYSSFPLPDMEDSLPRIRAYELHTTDAPLKGGLFVGFTGWVELTWPSKEMDKEIRRAACALARLSEFCATGSKTTMGMGQTRLSILEPG